MTDLNQQAPKVFISYCWSSTEHQQWVLDLAIKLQESHINVVIDVWDLHPGDDLHVFMESMVLDDSISFVLMICDEAYTLKANARHGGVGKESQIISQEIYSKTSQSKFIPIAVSRNADGTPCLPVYLASRFCFDFSDGASYLAEFDKLLRHIHRRPAVARPPLGPLPDFLKGESSVQAASQANLRTFKLGTMSGNSNAVYLARETTRSLNDDVNRLKPEGNTHEDVWDCIQRSLVLRDALIDLHRTLLQTDQAALSQELAVSFFENFFSNAVSPSSYRTTESEPSRFLAHEFLIHYTALCLAAKQYRNIATVCDEKFQANRGLSHDWVDCFSVDSPLTSIEVDRQASRQAKRISVKADLIKERSGGSASGFLEVQQADVVLSVRSIVLGQEKSYNKPWKPWTAVFCHPLGADPLPYFGKALAMRRYDGFPELFGCGNTSSLWRKFQTELPARGADRWHYNYESIPWADLLAASQLPEYSKSRP